MSVEETAGDLRTSSGPSSEPVGSGQPLGQLAEDFSPVASPPTSASVDQLAILQKAYLPLLASGGRISGGNLLPQQQQNNKNNNFSQRSSNNGPFTSPSSVAAMVSALSAVQQLQAQPQSQAQLPTQSDDSLPILQQQLIESFMQQQQQQSLQANDLLAALGASCGLPARQRTAQPADVNLMDMMISALMGGNSNVNSNPTLGDASPASTTPEAILSLLTGLGGTSGEAQTNDLSALLAQSQPQPQSQYDIGTRLASLNNNDSKLLPSSPPATGGTDLLGLLGASSDLLGALTGALNGAGTPLARQQAFGADFGALLNGAAAGNVGSDVNSTLAQFLAANSGATNSSVNGSGNASGFGFASSPSKSMDAYCEICDKNYCNRYFLKTHKQKKHGIYTDDLGTVVLSPTKSAPNSAGFFPSSSTSYESAQKRAHRPDATSENGGGAPKVPKLSAVSTTAFSSASAPPHSASETRKPAGDVFDFAEHLQRQSLGRPSRDQIDESLLTSAAAALFDPSSSSCGASSSGGYGCDMCSAECESNVALLQHKFTAHAEALLPAAGVANGGSHGVSDEISPPQSSSSSTAAPEQLQTKQQLQVNNSTGNNSNADVGGGVLSALSQQLPALLTPSVMSQLTGGDVDAASLLVVLSKLVGIGALGKEADNLLGSTANIARLYGANSTTSKQTTPKRQYTSTSKNYCDVCKKDVCNKYFLRTHMLKMHQIVIDENKPIIAKIDTNEKERTGSIMFRCDICLKEHRTRMELKQHKTDVHGIALQPPKSGGPRMSGYGSVGSTPPPAAATVPQGYEPVRSNVSDMSNETSQLVQVNHPSYYKSGSPAGSSSAEKGITNFLATKDESDDNGSVASESNNNINNNNNNNNNNILKIETSAAANFQANAEQLEQMLSSIAAAAGAQPKPEPSDGGGSAGVSSPSTSSSVTFDTAGLNTAPATVSTATGAVKSESFDKDEEPISYNVNSDMFRQLDNYKNLISQFVAASTASNNNNNNGGSDYGSGDSGTLRSPLLSSLENGELLRQVAMRMQQENQQHCLP